MHVHNFYSTSILSGWWSRLDSIKIMPISLISYESRITEIILTHSELELRLEDKLWNLAHLTAPSFLYCIYTIS